MRREKEREGRLKSEETKSVKNINGRVSAIFVYEQPKIRKKNDQTDSGDDQPVKKRR